MMPRIEETVETHATGSRWKGTGKRKNKCKAVKTTVNEYAGITYFTVHTHLTLQRLYNT